MKTISCDICGKTLEQLYEPEKRMPRMHELKHKMFKTKVFKVGREQTYKGTIHICDRCLDELKNKISMEIVKPDLSSEKFLWPDMSSQSVKDMDLQKGEHLIIDIGGNIIGKWSEDEQEIEKHDEL